MSVQHQPNNNDQPDPPQINALVSLARDALAKRGRGYTVNTNAHNTTQSQRGLRVTPLRSPEDPNGFDHGVDRNALAPRTHGRQTSVPSESTLARTSSLNNIARPGYGSTFDGSSWIQDTTHSPDLKTPPLPDLPTGLALAGRGSIGHSALKRVTTRESVDGPNTSPGANVDHTRSDGKPARSSGHAVRRDGPSRSVSRRPSGTQTDSHTVGDFAQEHLLASFINHADHKIAQCTQASRLQADFNIEEICGHGHDPSFDQMLGAIAHIVHARPKASIERLLHWRDMYVRRGGSARFDMKSPTVSIAPPQLDGRTLNASGKQGGLQHSTSTSQVSIHQSEIFVAERRSYAAMYLFCRVAIEILSQTEINALTLPLAEKLGDLVYTHQLRPITFQVLERFPLKRAQWSILTEFVGVLSGLDFDGISSKFLTDLKTFQRDLSVKSYNNKVTEAEAGHLLKSMRSLRLPTSPDKAWNRSCTFMHTVSSLFADVHGQAAKTAYCKVIGALLLPCADRLHTDFDRDIWRNVVGTLNDRLGRLATKPKYWQVAVTVQGTLMCVSPYATFNAKWQALAVAMSTKLRERHNRTTALEVICRLVWSYLQRTHDSKDAIGKSLEDLIRAVFFSGKRYSLSSEPAVADPLIQLIRIIGSKNLDFCFSKIIFPLMNYELVSARDLKELKIEQLDPDKTTIAIRAFLAILTDIEKNEAPRFPMAFGHERHDGSVNEHANRYLAGHTSYGRQSYASRSEKEARLANPASFSPDLKEYHLKFCKVLGKIAILCSETFGGQAVLEERFAVPALKTPIADAWNFNKREDNSIGVEERAGFYELLRVTIQALPRCLLGQGPPSPYLTLLCTATAHPERDIASCSAKSLLAIARQGHSQPVVDRFSSFVLSYDHRCFVMLDSSKAGANHLESTLRLYVDLLQVWMESLHEKHLKAGQLPLTESPSGSRNGNLDMSSVWTQIDRVESQGLLFLCSPVSRIRVYAIEILSIVTRLDKTLGHMNTRISSILEDNTGPVLDLHDPTLSSFEKSRLERGMRRGTTQSTLIELCSSNVEQESILWIKLFPKLIRNANEVCPVAVTQTREDVCSRLSQMHNSMEALDERHRLQQQPNSTFDGNPVRPRNLSSPAMAVTIAQWKLYLMFACTTLTRTGGSQSSAGSEGPHSRKISKSSQIAQDSISTATDLFVKVIPLLSASNPLIRDAAVAGLGSININLYKPLLECLDAANRQSGEEARKHINSHARAASSPRRTQSNNGVQVEIVQVYKLTAHFLQNPDVYKSGWILEHVQAYIKGLSTILHQVENDSDYHPLRIGYCGLVEGYYLGIAKTEAPQHWMSFGTRKAAFSLMEDWCGLASMLSPAHRLERSPRPSDTDGCDQLAARAHERNLLRIAALNAMATLCAGPIRILEDTGRRVSQFDPGRILTWIHNMFRTESDKTHATGRRALKNLISHNVAFPVLLERSIDKLYVAETAKCLESYIEVISDIIMSGKCSQLPFWKVFSALLFILGNEKSNIRMKSARLLRFLDEQDRKGSKLQDLDISISDKTTAVNKKAQFEISQRLATQHSEQAFWVFSEFSKHFSDLHADHKRNIVLALLPWIKTLELQLDPNGGPTASSYMLLVNLLKMTIDHSMNLHHEIQALWQALATGPHAGNVKLILDFMIDLCLERRDEKLVQVAKQVVVFLSSTPAGQKVIESLLLEIGPRNMWEEKGRSVHQPTEAKAFPHLAELSAASTDVSNLSNMSLGHLCLILLVDLIVAPINLPVDRVTLLLHAVIVLWDHRMEVVQEQAREMLVHLIHELVISKMDDADITTKMSSVEGFIEAIRRHDSKVVWSYDDNNARDGRYTLTEPMVYVVTEVVKIFSITYPGMQAAWGRVTLDWATHCPVRHLACRSLQIYRCLLTPLDPKTIVDLLHRLATSVADEEPTTQTYSIDIMRTLRTINEAVSPTNIQLLPHLFWTTCACLETIHESEFVEALAMLEVLLDKFDMGDAGVVSLLNESKPDEFQWSADVLSGMVYIGCRSGVSIGKTLEILDRLVQIPSNPIVGDESRLLFAFLANLPRLAQSFVEVSAPQTTSPAATLASVCRSQAPALARILDDLSEGRILNVENFLSLSLNALRDSFFPSYELQALTFLIGLLTNNVSWFRIQVLHILSVLLPNINLQKSGVVERCPDLISPLLRLLQTDLSPIAMRLLDNFLSLPGIKFNQSQLQMSMTGVRASRQARKQYDNSQSLYGIPDESGWSVPMPTVRKESVRRNITAMCTAFGDSVNAGLPGSPTPEVEFYKEEQIYGSYFPDRTGTMTSDEAGLMETNVGELMSKLDTLDDFFDDDGPETSPPYSFARSSASTPTSSTRQNHFHNFSQESMFNQNTSFNSHRGNATDVRPGAGREPIVMSPSMFSQSPRPLSRPGIQARSVTSPAVNQRTPPDKIMSVQVEDTEPFSDDETSFGRASTSDGSFILESHHRLKNGQRPFLQRIGMRSGVRRLMGSERSRTLRLNLEQSPEVPKVPEIYRQNIRSSDL